MMRSFSRNSTNQSNGQCGIRKVLGNSTQNRLNQPALTRVIFTKNKIHLQRMIMWILLILTRLLKKKRKMYLKSLKLPNDKFYLRQLYSILTTMLTVINSKSLKSLRNVRPCARTYAKNQKIEKYHLHLIVNLKSKSSAPVKMLASVSRLSKRLKIK